MRMLRTLHIDFRPRIAMAASEQENPLRPASWLTVVVQAASRQAHTGKLARKRNKDIRHLVYMHKMLSASHPQAAASQVGIKKTDESISFTSFLIALIRPVAVPISCLTLYATLLRL